MCVRKAKERSHAVESLAGFASMGQLWIFELVGPACLKCR